ncbi:RICIN domain-containing protein [Bacillus cereus]|uniref:Uncharacterized protein n=1 Tax=Bacillus cereus VD184 TaxID=1053242 RepID=A0A9W5R5M6_BACCE|nr:hypothetical protein [Bacillus cereus]EOQ09081.1 hypothetical protein IKC_06114 [Bacillus cereus VD184]
MQLFLQKALTRTLATTALAAAVLVTPLIESKADTHRPGDSSTKAQNSQELRVENGIYTIQSAREDSKRVGMGPANSGNYHNIQLFSYNPGALDTEFQFSYNASKDAYTIKSQKYSYKYMMVDVPGYFGGLVGTVMYPSDGDSGYWKIKDAGNGYVYLESLKSGTVMSQVFYGPVFKDDLTVSYNTGEVHQKFKLHNK